MAHGVTGGVQRLEFNALPHPDNITRLQAPVNAGNRIPGIHMGQQARPGGGDQRGITAGVVQVFVGVEYLGDIPPPLLCPGQAFLVIQGIHCHGLPRFRAGDQVVEIAVGVTCPDLFNNHDGAPPAGFP